MAAFNTGGRDQSRRDQLHNGTGWTQIRKETTDR